MSESVQPSCGWSEDRKAYDLRLPGGRTWNSQQIGWFVNSWWKHLASASLASFSESLGHFSAWASAEHGLECLIAWLPRASSSGEDLVTLQILELLEYAELPPAAAWGSTWIRCAKSLWASPDR